MNKKKLVKKFANEKGILDFIKLAQSLGIQVTSYREMVNRMSNIKRVVIEEAIVSYVPNGSCLRNPTEKCRTNEQSQ